MNAHEGRRAAACLDDARLSARMSSALRMLAVDMVEAANSGHPGAPLGMAEMALALWQGHLVHDPACPDWPDRDRFVLSNGHASALLYALLHLSGYALPREELRRFRQLGSRTPGHPEQGLTPGVETTTGPLGQGLANAVGMALAERLLAAEFNRPGHCIVDHRCYVFAGDGCLMEGLSQEAISLAGTLRLARLTLLYDANGISIDGAIGDWFADDSAARFAACGWRVIGPVDAHDVRALDAALCEAREGAVEGAGPALIVCRSTIGKGVPDLEGSAEVHGAPLGARRREALAQALDWPHEPFELPEELRAHWHAGETGAARRGAWQARFEAYARAHPALAAEFRRRIAGELPADWRARVAAALAPWRGDAQKPLATRAASRQVLDALAPGLPELLGGSADLSGSNLTDFRGHRRIGPGRAGNYLSYGVREFGMAALMNGVALHGGLIPFGGTFLCFSDYSRSAIRMAALMRQRVIHVFTHDSIALGEDGPTHQPVEHLASLRLIPGLELWRPADGLETAVAWTQALARRDGPSALVLSRQALAPVAFAADPDGVARGGYVLSAARGDRVEHGVLLATGSELALVLQAQARLSAAHGLALRVVSMPCLERFEAQPQDWRHAVLPPQLPCIAVEAGHPQAWARQTARDGAVLGLARFGESAPGPVLMRHFGFSVDGVVACVLRCLAPRRSTP
ncbi:transketolase [Pelomonas sp. CA6]|uniref:transketolase n=1 Tax=Pelomonas sp. CA6 TaxID=2907999 RepID=UPI001F4A8909|nr:transketolase [Pelomonas sp. CA6]MCH7342865.1 transketolase [Pelomonas sp. CA6]